MSTGPMLHEADEVLDPDAAPRRQGPTVDRVVAELDRRGYWLDDETDPDYRAHVAEDTLAARLTALSLAWQDTVGTVRRVFREDLAAARAAAHRLGRGRR